VSALGDIRRDPPLALSILAAMILAGPAWAEDLSVTRGRTFARANCAQCHAIGRTDESPLRIAPPFRDLHKRYPVESLEEPLAEGIMTGHPSMPQFQLYPDQISDLIAYMKTLED